MARSLLIDAKTWLESLFARDKTYFLRPAETFAGWVSEGSASVSWMKPTYPNMGSFFSQRMRGRVGCSGRGSRVVGTLSTTAECIERPPFCIFSRRQHARGACGRSCPKLYICRPASQETPRICNYRCAKPGRAPGVRIAEVPGSNSHGRRARDPCPPRRAAVSTEPRPQARQRSGRDPGATTVVSRHQGKSAPATAEDRTCGDRLPTR